MYPKKEGFFSCKFCDYTTMREANYKKHLLTRKHKSATFRTNLEQKSSKPEIHICENCGKKYKARNSLWYHKKKCILKQEKNNEEKKDESGFLVEEIMSMKHEFKAVLAENKKIQKKLLEEMENRNKLIETLTPSVSTTNNFNINIFLNEQCKNAINMSDFMNSLQIQVEDLNYTNEKGLIEGISSVLVNRLNQLQICERPIHCTDAKREVLYVKDNDSWEKEDENKTVKNSITDILYKQRVAMDDWVKKNPDWEKTEEGKSAYLNLVTTIMSNDLDNDSSKEKIIKMIAKETFIDKK